MIWKIQVTRTDGSIRDIEIMYDRNTEKYCFVNLTSHHVCECRFNSVETAMYDLMNDEKVKSFNVINCYEEIIKR